MQAHATHTSRLAYLRRSDAPRRSIAREIGDGVSMPEVTRLREQGRRTVAVDGAMTLQSLHAARQVYGEVVSPGARRVRYDILGVGGVCATNKEARRLPQQAEFVDKRKLPPVERSTKNVHRSSSCEASNEAWPRSSKRGRSSGKLIEKRPRSNPLDHKEKCSSLGGAVPTQTSQDVLAAPPRGNLGRNLLGYSSSGQDALEVAHKRTAPEPPDAAPTQSTTDNSDEEASGLPRRTEVPRSVPNHVSYADAQSAFLSDDSGSLTPDDDLLSMASSLTREKSECGGSIDSVDSVTMNLMSVGHEGGGKRKYRRKQNRKAVSSTLVGRRRNNVCRSTTLIARSASVKQWSLNERKLHKKMRRLTLAEQEGVTRVMEVFTGQVDGKGMGERDLFNLVSFGACFGSNAHKMSPVHTPAL